MTHQGPIVCFGEILLRLASRRGEMLLQNPLLDVCVGGAEANVAVMLARLGQPARMASVVPDNDLGYSARAELRRHGVDVDHVSIAKGRMGLYFLQPGAGARAPKVIYDRKGSAFAEADFAAMDWPAILNGASRLHLSGITVALNPSCARAAITAAKTARELGVAVSFDGNFRSTLWGDRRGEAGPLLAQIIEQADLAFVDHRDLSLMLEGNWQQWDDLEDAAAAAFAKWPKLKRIASTTRQAWSADEITAGASLLTPGGRHNLDVRVITGITDRVGTGDAFAAGMVFGLHRGMSDAEALDFAFANFVLKHSITGDMNLVSLADVQAFLTDEKDIRR